MQRSLKILLTRDQIAFREYHRKICVNIRQSYLFLGAVFTKFTSKLNFLGRWNSVLSRCPQAELSADRRSKLFSQEKQRQIDLVKRVEKIKVQYCGAPENVTLYLNKDLSTPFNVAQRMWQSRILLFQKSVFETRPSCIYSYPI